MERAISITIDLLAINGGTLTLRSGLVTKGRPIRWSIEPKVAAPFVGGTSCKPLSSIKGSAAPRHFSNYRVSPENKRHPCHSIDIFISSHEGTHWIPTHNRTTNDNKSK